MSGFWFFSAPAVVEDYREEDAVAMSNMHADAFAHVWSSDEISALLASDAVHALVIRRPNPYGTRALLGFVIYRNAADEAEILTIAIDKRKRRKGLGQQLMEEVSRRLYADRIDHLFLEVDADNLPALTLYQKLGFAKVGERQAYYTSGEKGAGTALIMRYNLR
ncbi:MAG: ribosomal protein S18-alanine N-acetyltransferase [Stappiaceae bacterium]